MEYDRRESSSASVPKIGLILLITLSVVINTCEGYGVYFPLSNVKMMVPKTENYLKILNKKQLAQFQILSANNSINTSDFMYKLVNGDNLLQINGRSGELFIGRNFGSLKATLKFSITARNPKIPTQSPAHMTFEIEPFIPTEDFCSDAENLCFWNAAVYTVSEDIEGSLSYNPRKIGELGPQSYNYLCPQNIITYSLQNETAKLEIKDNILYAHGNIDHDSSDPGSSLSVGVQCLLKSRPNSDPQELYKSIHITIIDRNDNGPTLQEDKGTIINLDNPHFTKDHPVGEKNIIFLDKDSLATNSHISYEIHKDSLSILSPICRGYEADHERIKNSVINCKIVFSRNGVLRKSPYCVKLEAKDNTVESKTNNSAVAAICLTTDLTKLHASDLPKPLALPLSLGRRKNKQRLIQSSEESLSSSGETGFLKNGKQITIEYPHRDVYIYRTAGNLSRVTQPVRMQDLLNRTSIKFKIEEDPTKAFGITQKAGIVYVKNLTALQTAPETIYYLSISWIEGNVNLAVHLQDNRPPQTVCNEIDPKHPSPSCAEAGNRYDCNQLCGVATTGAACQWRDLPETATGFSLRTDYATCSPNLETCPDNVCDPLEEIGQIGDVFVCPQDCATQIYGPHRIHDNKMAGIYSASGVCTCDHFGKCTCAPAEVQPSKKKNGAKSKGKHRHQDLTPSILKYSVPSEQLKDKDASFECGPSCLMLAIACPTILVMIIIGLIISRRNYVRRVKRTTFSEEKNRTDEDSNRITELPLVTLENDFKFEGDSKWEFPRELLILDMSLGEGEFGKVVKAFATNIADRTGVTTVAVKMLKTGANSVEHLALLSEFQLLQEVSHPNVIKLLGACTKGDNPLLIIEYAVFGSLRNYLRLTRKIECSGIEFTNGIEIVTAKDILSFAWQICKGMAYLTEIKLVHRDLAARNVLLAEGKICKISDFGLTRDVYEDDAYLKRSKDRVPVKWMAPESLADHVYTTKSDVWAFGILCWELITLGTSPYPGIPPQNLYHLLKTGYRMERPENCSEEIYSIVRSCWADDSSARPSFKLLASQWEKLLGNNAKYIDFHANAVSNPVYCPEPDDAKPPESGISKESQTPEEFGTPETLDHLWRSPQLSNEVLSIEHSNSADQCGGTLEEAMGARVPPGYDMPRPLIETKTTEQNRYANDVRFPMNIKIGGEHPVIDSNHYSVPVKRGKSYIDMTNKNVIAENLNTEDIEKKLSKNISFRFSSLLNLNDQATSAV